MPIIRPTTLALVCAVVLMLLPALPASSQDQNVVAPSDDKTIDPLTLPCDGIMKKILNGELLNERENVQLGVCNADFMIGQDLETPEGWTAMRQPDLYGMHDFLDIPGILGNNLVDG